MSTQASVQSVDALKDLRVALALFAEDTLAALGAVDMEVRRTIQWLQNDRRMHWQEQIKRRKEQVAMAQAEVFRRKLASRPDYSPAYSEQKEILRKAEASLKDAEMRAALVKKWEPALQQAALEYRGSTRRLSSIAGGDIPRAIALLERMIDALEAYLREPPPSSAGLPSPLETVAESFFRDEPVSQKEPDQEEKPPAPDSATADSASPGQEEKT